MTTKKVSKKKGGGGGNVSLKPAVPGDPPIIVGGGGSSYLWVNFNQDETTVNPTSNDPVTGVKPGAPTPTNRGNYSCSRVKGGPARVFFFDGVNPEKRLDIPPAGRTKWYIRVD